MAGCPTGSPCSGGLRPAVSPLPVAQLRTAQYPEVISTPPCSRDVSHAKAWRSHVLPPARRSACCRQSNADRKRTRCCSSASASEVSPSDAAPLARLPRSPTDCISSRVDGLAVTTCCRSVRTECRAAPPAKPSMHCAAGDAAVCAMHPELSVAWPRAPAERCRCAAAPSVSEVLSSEESPSRDPGDSEADRKSVWRQLECCGRRT